MLQTCSLTNDTDCTTVDKYISLPGKVTLTLSPSNSDPDKQTVYSLSNDHGDTVLTLTGEGKTTASTNTLLGYGPFGEMLLAGTLGTTAQNQLNAIDSTMGWAADPNRKQDGRYTTAFIQMGARIYVPSLGRFLQVDPMEGGTLNAYVYAHDPVNSDDYSGEFIPFLIAAVVRVVPVVVRVVNTINKAAKAAQAAASAQRAAQAAARAAQAARNAAAAAARSAQAARQVIQKAASSPKKTVPQAVKKPAVTQKTSTKNMVRTEPKNLAEQLTRKEVLSNPKAGTEIMKGRIGDPSYSRWMGWRKMEYIHESLSGGRIEMHYFYNIFTRSVSQLKYK